MNLKILFVRHGATTPLDKSIAQRLADPVRVLTAEGIARADEVATDLAPRKFRLAINTFVPRTIQTCDRIVSKQRGLNDIVGLRSLYMPLDLARTERMFELFDTATTPRLAWDVPEIRSMCENQAYAILHLCQIYGNPDTLVVDHNILIQLIVHAMGATADVLDYKLDPCDGVELTITDEAICCVSYKAPKLAA